MEKIQKKEDRRIEKTQKSIRDAIINLLQDKDISQITIKELSEKANINRKTFYMHFSSIKDVLDKIENGIIDKFMIILNEYDFGQEKFDGYAFFTSLNNIINEDLNLYKKLIRANSYDFLLTKVKKILKDNLIQRFNDVIDKDKDILNLYAEFAASGIISMYIEWFNNDSPISLEELAATANNIAFRGINSVLE